MTNKAQTEKSVICRIKKQMEEKNLTAYALAKACDMPPSTIGRILSGQASPRASTLASIALALDTSIESLIGKSKAKELLEKNSVLKAVQNKRIPLITPDCASWLRDDLTDENQVLSSSDIVWLPGMPSPELSSIVDFCMVAPDDAMYPEIKKGEFLYFRKVDSSHYAQSGDVVAVFYRHDAGDAVIDIRRVIFHQGFEEFAPSETMKGHIRTGRLDPDSGYDEDIRLNFGIVGVLVAKLSLSPFERY